MHEYRNFLIDKAHHIVNYFYIFSELLWFSAVIQNIFVKNPQASNNNELDSGTIHEFKYYKTQAKYTKMKKICSN